ncbi:hypothetical protein [Sphingomonas oleivorans]|nr:hypothetical protein [Sphingomonas oleivorans]
MSYIERGTGLPMRNMVSNARLGVGAALVMAGVAIEFARLL